MAESVIERAARAVREADGAYLMERTGGWMKEGGVVGDGHWIDLARAVIEALREPSESMLDAVSGRFTVEEHFIEAGLIVGAEALWRAMIDEALK